MDKVTISFGVIYDLIGMITDDNEGIETVKDLMEYLDENEDSSIQIRRYGG